MGKVLWEGPEDREYVLTWQTAGATGYVYNVQRVEETASLLWVWTGPGPGEWVGLPLAGLRQVTLEAR